MKHTYQLQFHPVWEEKLSQSEKDVYTDIHQKIPFVAHTLNATMIRTKIKKDHEMVATTFIHNGFDTPVTIDTCQVNMTNDHGISLAEGKFSPHLLIQPHCSIPWSFIFEEQMIHQHPKHNEKVQVEVKQI